jgi:hypothetical protein
LDEAPQLVAGRGGEPLVKLWLGEAVKREVVLVEPGEEPDGGGDVHAALAGRCGGAWAVAARSLPGAVKDVPVRERLQDVQVLGG